MFSKLIVLVAVLALTNCTYTTQYTYNNADGAGCFEAKLTSQFSSIPPVVTCTPSACTAPVLGVSRRVTCDAVVPLGYGETTTNYAPLSNCTGNIVTRSSGNLRNCTRVLVSSPARYEADSCDSSNNLLVKTYSDNKCTVETGERVDVLNLCQASGTQKKSCVGGPQTISGICFHKDTVITYEGKQLTLQDLEHQKHSECNVPHIVRSKGVVITTSCSATPLRLTSNHLVVTQKMGHKMMIAAREMRKGDLVFGNMQETKKCTVTNIQEEKTVQEYFGLNCINSVVLANGVKTSTFGVYHRLPAMWMRHASKILGVHRASRWGAHLAAAGNKIGLVSL